MEQNRFRTVSNNIEADRKKAVLVNNSSVYIHYRQQTQWINAMCAFVFEMLMLSYALFGNRQGSDRNVHSQVLHTNFHKTQMLAG